MIAIGEKMNGFCSMCAVEKDDVRAITLFVRGNRDSYNRTFLCENHLRQIAETINILFEDGEHE